MYWSRGLWTSSAGIAWEPVRNAETKALPWAYWIRICTLTRLPQWSESHERLRCTCLEDWKNKILDSITQTMGCQGRPLIEWNLPSRHEMTIPHIYEGPMLLGYSSKFCMCINSFCSHHSPRRYFRLPPFNNNDEKARPWRLARQ